MAQAWRERIDKENAMAEKAQTEAALSRNAGNAQRGPGSVASYRSSDSRSTKRSCNTNALRSKLEELEHALDEERTLRLKVEKDLQDLKRATTSDIEY